MQKSKLGVSNNLIAMFLYVLALMVAIYNATFGVYAFILLAAYILLKEENFLKGHVVTAAAAILLDYVIAIAFSLVPDFLEFLNFFLQFAKIRIYDGWGITGFLQLLVKWAFEIVLVILAISALKGKESKLFKKHVQ